LVRLAYQLTRPPDGKGSRGLDPMSERPVTGIAITKLSFARALANPTHRLSEGPTHRPPTYRRARARVGAGRLAFAKSSGTGPRFNDYPLVPQCDLGRAIGADLRKAVQVAVFDRGVVASAEGAVTDHSAIAPSLGGCDVPDVLVLALQAERILRAKLLSQAGSLPSRG